MGAAVVLGTVVTVVPLLFIGCRWVWNYFYPQDSVLKVCLECESEPCKCLKEQEVCKKEAAPAPKQTPAPEAKAAAAPAKKTTVVDTPKNNNLIIGLIIACIIGMLITGYFVCIRKDEEDSDIENPEAPASGNRRNSQDSADIQNAAAFGVNF